MRRIAVLVLFLLAGCATPQPVVQVQQVKVPVSVPCLPKVLPVHPDIMPNAKLRVMPDYEMLLEIAAERDLLISYTGQLEAVISGCR